MELGVVFFMWSIMCYLTVDTPLWVQCRQVENESEARMALDRSASAHVFHAQKLSQLLVNYTSAFDSL